ncbi:prepilin peptidase [Actinoplanes oblitus]|uniref:Prepilin peptidase n=1 Tax=Actinoplanes oblitus TaxID=3040509 RepID=A0ABY8WV54_9ACTN|nr:prepilin peptidase [Actinoplanes oblitus]WIN01012.1 prepilin peptidase [Actinoplanes oblitus]
MILAVPALFPAGRCFAGALSALLAAGLLAARLGAVPQLPVLLLGVETGVLLAVIDLRTLRLPDPLVGTLAAGVGVPLALLAPARIGPALLAAVLTGAGYLLIAVLPGHGLGFGDVKLAAVLALLVSLAAGWPAVLTGVLVAHLIGAGVAVVLLATRRRRIFPFGPALLIGAFAALLTAA